MFLFLLIPLLGIALLLMPRQYVTRQVAAKRYGVTDKTIGNMISTRLITGYKLPGIRAIRVDLNGFAGAGPSDARRDPAA